MDFTFKSSQSQFSLFITGLVFSCLQHIAHVSPLGCPIPLGLQASIPQGPNKCVLLLNDTCDLTSLNLSLLTLTMPSSIIYYSHLIYISNLPSLNLLSLRAEAIAYSQLREVSIS